MPTSALCRAWRRDALQARSSAWRTVAHRCAIRRQGRAARSGRLLEEGDRLDLDDSVFRGQTDDLTDSALARTTERRTCTHVRAGSRSPMCLTSATGQMGRGRACDVQIWIVSRDQRRAAGSPRSSPQSLARPSGILRDISSAQQRTNALVDLTMCDSSVPPAFSTAEIFFSACACLVSEIHQQRAHSLSLDALDDLQHQRDLNRLDGLASSRDPARPRR